MYRHLEKMRTLLYTDKSLKDIAFMMDIKPNTARSYSICIYRERKVSGRIELMAREIVRLRAELENAALKRMGA
jgi:hypothetical protein